MAVRLAKRIKPAAPGPDTVTADDIASMRPLLIRASAGTGKTYQLTGRLLRILLDGAAPDSLIATTFTRKAAGEILTRVLLSLARAATDPSGVARQQLADQTGLATLSTDDCIQLTHSLLRDIHRLRIMTLDSLFSQLAKSFSYEIGVPPGWRLTDEIEEVAIRESAVDAMLSHLQATDVVALLAQLGKGDTKRSVRREMVRVVEDGYQISRGCTEQAWDSLRVPRGPADTEIRAASEILSQAVVGNKSADKVLQCLGERMQQGAWDEVVKTPLICRLGALGADEDVVYCRKTMPAEVAQALRVAAAAAKTQVLGLLRAQTLATGRVIEAYETQVATIKQAARAFSFDDIAYRLAQSLSPVSMNQIANRMDGSIDHLLLDEFQDTSPVQWSVLKPLATTTAREGGGSFFCVGDTKQAIYGWRGGVAEIFDQVCTQINDVVEREQNTSFRSSQVIVDAVNQIFKNLHRHPEVCEPAGSDEGAQTLRPAVSNFVNAFPMHRSAKPDLPGYVSIRSSDAKAKHAATRKLLHMKYVAQRIAESARLAPNSTIGVLTRTNLSVAWLIQLLRSADVDVSQEGGNPLVDSPAVEMVLSALMMTEHPGDRRWAFHVAHSPLAAWLQLSQFDDAEACTGRLRRLIEDDGIGRTVETIAAQLVPHCDEGDVLRLRQLVYLAQQYEINRGDRLTDFVRVVQNKRIEKPRPAQVRVMTVHQAKGLEFDVVVLPELDGDLIQPLSGTIGLRDQMDQPPKALLRFIRKDAWPLLPDVWQKCFSDQLQAKYTESLCLLYVAMTRPRQWLDVIVQPAGHAQPKTKTAAALLYHATGCECDATQDNQTWFEAGNPHWYRS